MLREGEKGQMRIKKYTFVMGNDFAAIMVCEHCGGTQKLTSGYHDNYYHTKVIPAMTCRKCGKNRDGITPTTRNDSGLVSMSNAGTERAPGSRQGGPS